MVLNDVRGNFLFRNDGTGKFEEIGEWSELGDFLDLPVRTYSSGMFGRLAFSVAVHMEPDILLVDEALSAGDAAFKAKATAKMEELLDQAHTMVLVSHALATVEEMCSDAIWMEKGELKMMGKPADVIWAYADNENVDASAATTREDV